MDSISQFAMVNEFGANQVSATGIRKLHLIKGIEFY